MSTQRGTVKEILVATSAGHQMRWERPCIATCSCLQWRSHRDAENEYRAHVADAQIEALAEHHLVDTIEIIGEVTATAVSDLVRVAQSGVPVDVKDRALADAGARFARIRGRIL